MLPTINRLSGLQALHAGGHNWPDMQVVIDPEQSDVEDDGIYLIQVKGRDPIIKRLAHKNSNELYLHPALSTVHGQSTIELLGRKIPCQSIEFSDNIYTRYVTVIGRVIGIWAAAEAA